MQCYKCGAPLNEPYIFCEECDSFQTDADPLDPQLSQSDFSPAPSDGLQPQSPQARSAPVIESPLEPHMACIILIDTSDSMAGYPISSINKALQRLIAKIRMDEQASRRVDIAVVGYSTDAYVIADFTPIAQIEEPFSFSAGGMTAMGAGIDLAVDMLYDRRDFYESMGTPVYRPWIFMVSCSSPTDDTDYAAYRILYEETRDSSDNLRFFALGAGYYDKTALLKITNRVMELTDEDFESIFSWIGDSILRVSASLAGEEAKLGDLPANARVITI